MAAFAAGCLGCTQSPEGANEPVEIDLTSLPLVFIDDRAEETARHRQGTDGPGLLLAPGSTLELYPVLPARATLRFDLPAAAQADGLRIAIADEQGWKSPAVERLSDSQRRIPLGQIRAGPVRLRIENAGSQPVSWLRPRIKGFERWVPPSVPRPRSSRKPNVLLYVVDTLRADRLSLYGYERPTSPALERLAEKAIVFEQAYAPSSHTIPSISALFASRMPSELSGRLDRESAPDTLAEAFRQHGYRTAAFQANFLLTTNHGYDRGFDTYRLFRTAERPNYVNAEFLHGQVEKWLDEGPAEPFFLYVQTMDVHSPYEAPAPFGEMFLGAPPPLPPELTDGLDESELDRLRSFNDAANPDRYDGGVAYADHQIGQLMAALEVRGLRERTIVVITSDHGEPLWQRGEFRHGMSLHEELVRIPLMLSGPDIQGRRVADIVSLLDLGPTLLDLAGASAPASFLGATFARPRLAPVFAVGELPQVRKHETLSWFLRWGRWKLLVEEAAIRLYDLEEDPGETHDLSAARPARTRALLTQLHLLSPSIGRHSEPIPLGRGLSEEAQEELEEALRALGYVE